MSWSNVLDYLDYGDFHRIDRACSVHGDTIHVGYSMNWVMEVYGTNIIDFLGKEGAKVRADCFDSANNSVDLLYKTLGWDRHLRSPPLTNPINTSSNYCLEILHYRKWAEHFCRLGPQ